MAWANPHIRTNRVPPSAEPISYEVVFVRSCVVRAQHGPAHAVPQSTLPVLSARHCSAFRSFARNLLPLLLTELLYIPRDRAGFPIAWRLKDCLFTYHGSSPPSASSAYRFSLLIIVASSQQRVVRLFHCDHRDYSICASNHTASHNVGDS